MNTESILNYVTLHSQSMIQWLFLVILALVGILIAQSLFGRRDHGAPAPGAGASNLGATPNPLIEQTTRAGGPAGAVAAGGSDDERLTALRAELTAREAEIVKLREGVSAGAPSAAPGSPAATAAASGPDPELAARLKQLEAKLAEYEILEDDIADLSLYKDENVRLKNELEILKGRASSAESTAVTPPPAPTDLESLSDGEAPASTQPARTAEAARDAALAAAAFDEPAPAAAAPTIPAEGADDLFAEFASALESNVDAASTGKAVGES